MKVLPALVAVVAVSAVACTATSASPVHRSSAPFPLAQAGPSTTGAPPRSPATSSPVRPRPLPPAPLPAALDALLFNTNSCLLVTDGGTGQVLYGHEPDLALTPASAQKLLIAAAALDRLGAEYRFTTTVVAAAPPVAGVVADLWLVGSGDPLLATPEYAALLRSNPVTAGYQLTPISLLADQVAARGVRVVVRGVHGDDRRYEALRYLPSWGPTINRGELDVGPLGALEVDQGLDSWHPAMLTADPAGHGAGVLARLLGARGITAAQASDAPGPATPVVLGSVQSAPLAQIVESMLQASDNQIAELLVRELDRQSGGAGTTAGGVRVVMAEAAKLGLPTGGLSLADGSGLSHANRVTCRTLLAALGLGDQPALSAITAGLPVAGVSGGLVHLFTGTPLTGRLAAKGGYITGVAALAGRIAGPRPRRFALIVNGSVPFATGLALEEGVAEAIATR